MLVIGLDTSGRLGQLPVVIACLRLDKKTKILDELSKQGRNIILI